MMMVVVFICCCVVGGVGVWVVCTRRVCAVWWPECNIVDMSTIYYSVCALCGVIVRACACSVWCRVVTVCVRECVRACARVCVCVCV